MTDTAARFKAGIRDRYEIEEEIGHGGMAIVYRARDVRHGRAVAIKVLRDEVGAALGSERFLQEIRIESQLQHPNILPLHDSGTVDGIPYYVMPYVEGESLRDRLEREGQLPVEDVLRIAQEVGEALHYAHTQGLVHRDVKPENVLLSSGHAIVADFGIARALSEAGGERLTATGMAIGTPAYMSPEQASGTTRIDVRSDVYSLGCVVYEMLVGEPPFGGRTAQAVLARHMQERPPSIEVVRPDIPPRLILAVEKALAKTPADRFRTVRDFVQALSAEGPRAPPWPRLTRRRRLMLGSIAGFMTAVAGFWWLQLRPREPPPDPNRLVVFPLLERGLSPADSGVGLDVAIMIGTALDGTEPLRQIDGWTYLDPAMRANPELIGVAEERRITLARGARYFINGVVQAAGDTLVVALQVFDAVGESLLTRASARGLATVPAYRLGLTATNRLMPVLLGGAPELDSASLMNRRPAAVALFIQGERAYRGGDFGAALEFYQRAVGEDSLLVVAAMRGAQAAGWEHRPRDAEQLVGLAVRHDSLLPRRYALLARGLASYVVGDADSAMLWVEQALAEDSAWIQAHMILAEVAQHLLPRDRDSLEQVAERGFHAVLERDSGFAPAVYHLAQHALLRGDLVLASRLLERLRANEADPGMITELELAEQCLRHGSAPERWQRVSPSDAQRAAKLLATRGTALQCAEEGFRTVYHSALASPAERWGALLGLNGALAARGRWSELRVLLDSAVAGGLSQALLLYMLDTYAGAPFEPEAARGEAFARQLFGGQYAGASSQILWFLGTWFLHLGDLRRAEAVLDSLEGRLVQGGSRARFAMRDALAAQLAAAGSDTAAALTALRSLAPVSSVEVLGYDLTASHPVERMRLAELELASGAYERAHRVAASFDGEAIVNLPFLPASLRIRAEVASRLGRRELLERYHARLREWGWSAVAVQ